MKQECHQEIKRLTDTQAVSGGYSIGQPPLASVAVVPNDTCYDFADSCHGWYTDVQMKGIPLIGTGSILLLCALFLCSLAPARACRRDPAA